MEGQIIYKTEYLRRYGLPRQITIKRILPSNSTDLEIGSEDAMRDSFSDLAEIHYKIFSSSRIRYNGTEVPTSVFFRKGGFGLTSMGRNRVFTGPDGKEYEWELRSSSCKLYLKEVPRPLVATYHTRHFGIIGEARPASLEIFPEGEHMVDLIFVTFIFIEKLRMQKKTEVAASGN
jgi:hypothetical protein